MKKILILALLMFPLFVLAQVNDDFTDGDITANPTWSGDVGSYEILDPPVSLTGAINPDAGNDAFVLRSTINTGDAVITTQSDIAYGQWIFSVADGRDWSISSTNDYIIILMSDDNTPANLVDGALNFNGYFLRLDGSMDDQFVLYKQTADVSEVVIDTDFPLAIDGATPLGRTIKITRSETGNWAIFIADGFEVTPTIQYGATTNDNSHTTSNYFGISTNISSPSEGRVLMFDNLQITPISTSDATSIVSAGTDSEPATISSLTTSLDGIQVFDVNFLDAGTTDLLPTIIDNITFTQGDNNNIADWTNAIAGAKLFGTDIPAGVEGTINATNITFASDDFININDGENETYQLYIWLKTDLSNINDNDNIEIKLDYSNITCDFNGSSFGSGSQESGDNNIAIDIEATQINFVSYPLMITMNSDFSLSISATDINNNIDTDNNSQVILSLATGSGSLTSLSGLTQNLNSGNHTWSDLKYDQLGDFSIQAEGLSTITTATIECLEIIYHLNDNFEDADLLGWQSNDISRWLASDDVPINGSYSMKHVFDGSGDTDIMAHQITNANLSTETKVWRFQLKYENSAPSGNNNWNIFLMADNDETQMMSGGAINGYVVGINFGSETDDIVKLWNITNGAYSQTISTTFDWNNTESSTPKGFEISRTTNGEWEIKIDEDGGFDNLVSYGTATDTDHTTAEYFGILYKYSSTMDRKLTIDDVYFGPIIQDLEPPILDTAIALSPNILEVYFNEDIDQTIAETSINYFVDNSIGSPTTAVLDADNKMVTLTFASNFQNNIDYMLTAQNIEDLNGNVIVENTANFSWLNIELLNIRTVSLNKLELEFSKLPSIASAENISNYIVDNSIGNPVSASFIENDSLKIEIIFASNFEYGTLYNLVVSNVEDRLGNAMQATNFDFEYISTILDDDFEDGDISDWQSTDITRWASSNEAPINGSYSLRQIYDGTESSTDVIAHPLSYTDFNAEQKVWRFQIKFMNPSPSSTNTWSVFLISDQDETGMLANNSLNAYVLGVNYANSNDTLTLWKVTDGTKTELLKTDYYWDGDYINTDIPKGIEVSRTETGEWEVKVDDNGNFNELTSCGTATNTDLFAANYFGVSYKYSSTLDTLLWIDDVYLGSFIPDAEPPVVDTVIAISSTQLEVYFNEEIDQTTAENIANYTVNNDIGNPETATKNTDNNKLVILEFTTEFQSATDYLLTTENIEDLNNNIMLSSDNEFVWENIYLVSANVISNSQIDLHFSKEVNTTSANILTNYSINQTVGNPDNVIIDENGTTVHLSFPTLFQVGQEYILTINNIEDLNGNLIETTTYSFSYYEVQQFDVVINEIMIDVSPQPVALPDEKYIELYNPSSHDIDLTAWTIQIGTNSAKTFPAATIAASEYLIICGDGDESLFKAYGNVIGFLSTSQISSTTGKTIIIRNNKGDVIENITYSPDWYNDDEKDNGGWALERIDPTNVCYQDNNWQASRNYIGGTPGMQNSVFASNPDNQNPRIESFDFISSKHINIKFTEGVEKVSGESGINYILNNTTTPLHISIDDNDLSLVRLEFVENFNFGSNTIEIANISDNCSNTINDTTLNFTYQLINAQDVEPKSINQIKVYFSETISKNSAENVNNYSVNNGIGKPSIAFRDVNDTSVVHLQFANNFTEDLSNTLTISGVNDINGNLSTSKNLNFTYHQNQMFDIVFNEIMTDVNPKPVGLPEYQYVELYNTTDYVIWLSDWQFIAEDQTERNFPIISIQPKSYIILSQDDEDFSDKGTNVNILGSSDISNSGKELLLKDNFGELINYVDYSDLWYQDENKEDGGWSLEKIDPMNFCGQASNWAASTDIAGGTPGAINSIHAENPNDIIPEITQVKIISSNHLLVEFNKNISFNALLDKTNYSVNNGVGQPSYIIMSDTSYTTAHLYFENQFVDEQTNTITINNIYDDCQNQMETSEVEFTYYLIRPETIWVLNNYQLKIKFTEEPSFASVSDLYNYFVNKEIGNPNQAIKDGTDPSIVYLQFDNEFENGQTYSISLSNIKDVNQNSIIETELEFTYYITTVNDIVINELLFNPYSGGQDFVELYNRSIYPINMINMRIAKRNLETNEIETIYSINEHDYILNPESYLILTVDTAAVQMDYKTEGHFIEMSSMPSYPDDEGIVVILNEKDSIIDEFHYNEDMHYGLISNTDGVSLERIDYNMPSDSSNWHSAAQAVGYATPGYKNSQYKNMSDVEATSEITLEPQVFSPDEDGYNDITNIYYEFEEGGNIANIVIYDVNGRLIRTLTTNELLAASGFWTWDGLDENGQKARIGIYAVIIEIFDINGNVKTYKLACVVAGKTN